MASRSPLLVRTTVADVVDHDGVTAHFQPIVDLVSLEVVGVEALARGPVGPLHSPAALFEAAADEGLTEELEWACRGAALRGALDAGLHRDVALFVNVESRLLGSAAPAAVARLEQRARGRFPVVLELTERDLVRRPAEVLQAVYEARSQGWGIALDDVGAEPASLALMPVVRPDVVKLDLALVQSPPSLATGRIACAVSAYAEESGATVLAEGIETPEHHQRALALGATIGQGWLFGRPEPAIHAPGPSRPLRLITDRTPDLAGSPFDVVGSRLPTRISTKSHLLMISHQIERQTAELPTPPLLLGAFEHARHFTASTAARYTRYAATSSLVAAIGLDLDTAPAPNVRGAALADSDPLTREWTVVVLSPHFAAALIARDLGDTGPDLERRFEFALTHDRGHVTTAARCLIERITRSR